jgi:LysM repeat protein
MRGKIHDYAMCKIYWLPFSSALLLILTGCANNGGSSGNDPLGTGPFDSRGNYREEWANDPSKWRKPGSRSQPAASSDDVPVIAKNEQPPPNANPLASSGATNSKKTPIQVSSLPRETTHHAEKSKPEVAHATPRESTRVEEHKPSGSKGKSRTTAHVAKSKPKAKSKSGRYVVKQGDNLWDIARRNGSSVAAIQKANDLSGTLIHPGKTLTIPKR